MQLDGQSTSPIKTVRFRSLPAGWYEVIGSVYNGQYHMRGSARVSVLVYPYGANEDVDSAAAVPPRSRLCQTEARTSRRRGVRPARTAFGPQSETLTIGRDSGSVQDAVLGLPAPTARRRTVIRRGFRVSAADARGLAGRPSPLEGGRLRCERRRFDLARFRDGRHRRSRHAHAAPPTRSGWRSTRARGVS